MKKRARINETMTGFRSLNTVGRNGPQNVLTNPNGDQTMVTRQGGNVLDDADEESSLPKRAACVLVFHPDGERVLAVSRKDDPTDFGMPGGKVDTGESPEQAAVRETKEETGLDVVGLRHVFDRIDANDYVTYTFIAEVEGSIDTVESGVVRWVTPETLMKGSFAEYNTRLFQRLGIV